MSLNSSWIEIDAEGVTYTDSDTEGNPYYYQESPEPQLRRIDYYILTLAVCISIIVAAFYSH